MRLTRNVALLTITLFIVGMTLFVYGFEHRADADRARETGADEAVVLMCVALLHVALGAVLRWKALPALLLPGVIALPAGGYPGRWPEGSVAQTMFTSELVYGVLLVAFGGAIAWRVAASEQGAHTVTKR